MNYLAGVSLLNHRKAEGTPSGHTHTTDGSLGLNYQRNKVNNETATPNTEHNPPKVDTPGRSTRWSSALISGVDPRTLYGNKRFDTIYESWGSSRQKKPRKTQPPSKVAAKVTSVAENDNANLSEDDCDNTIPNDKNTVLAVLNTIAEVVTTLITKIRFAVEVHAVGETCSYKTTYGTRSTATQQNNKRAGGRASVNHKAKRDDPGPCNNLDIMKNDLELLIQRTDLLSGKIKRDVVFYYITEYIKLRAKYYYRMIRNMQRLEQHSKENGYHIGEMLYALIQIYRCAALGHLESLRMCIPRNIKRSGVLDFRSWRSGINMVPVTMEYLHSILLKFDYGKMKERGFLQSPRVGATLPLHKTGPQRSNIIPPPCNAAAKPKGITEEKTKLNAPTNMGFVKLPMKPPIKSNGKPATGQTCMEVDPKRRVNHAAKQVARNSSIKQKYMTASIGTESVSNRNANKAFGHGKVTLPEEVGRGSIATEGTPHANSTSAATFNSLAKNRDPSTPTANNNASSKRAPVSRRSYQRSTKGSEATAEGWKNLRIPQMFERVKPHDECSIKIPKRKPNAAQASSHPEAPNPNADNAGAVQP
ncbi:hypothetical protein X943_003864 [Babesia divergens]|uniref:Uncharacterized protein n=1 Tax=Babesia divergens TaxID=32595 RepID=A0AAD9GAW3_BABDI|nr:hypothetical protein X943_003864 [Babesia divergens]